MMRLVRRRWLGGLGAGAIIGSLVSRIVNLQLLSGGFTLGKVSEAGVE